MIRYSEIYASKDKDLREKRRDSDSIYFILRPLAESHSEFWHTNIK